MLKSNLYLNFLQTCSQLIKAGLKLSLEMKRKISSSESSGPDNIKMAKHESPNTSDDDDDDDDDMDSKSMQFGVSYNFTILNMLRNKFF